MNVKFFKRHRILVIAGIIFALYVGYTLMTQESKYQQLLRQKTLYEEQIEVLQEDLNELQDELEHSTSPETIERLAREKLKMVKPNEIIYIIQSDDESETENTPSEGKGN